MSAQRIPVELFAEIEGEDVLIKAQPLDQAAVTLMRYPIALNERGGLTALRFGRGLVSDEIGRFTGVEFSGPKQQS